MGNEYDLMAIKPSEWLTFDGRTASFSKFSCNDCNTDTDCNNHGICNAKQCNCSDGYYGKKCKFDKPCEVIKTQTGTHFPSYSDQYYLLRQDDDPPLVYGRPVYISKEYN